MQLWQLWRGLRALALRGLPSASMLPQFLSNKSNFARLSLPSAAWMSVLA